MKFDATCTDCWPDSHVETWDTEDSARLYARVHEVVVLDGRGRVEVTPAGQDD